MRTLQSYAIVSRISHPVSYNYNYVTYYNNYYNYLLDNCNRIILQPMDDIEDCQRDYVNASFIDVSSLLY